MKKAVKALIITLASLVGAAGLAVGGVALYRHYSVKPVNVYDINNICMTDYYGDVYETDGMVETRNMQSIFVSPTQSITEVYVREGQTVKEGDPLMSVDTTLTEIEVERQRLALEKTKLDLENAKAERAKIDTYRIYVPPAPEPEPEELPAETLPRLLGGEGTAERPYIYLWNEQQWYSQDFINGFLPKTVDKGQKPEGEDSEAQDPAAVEESAATGSEEEPSEDPAEEEPEVRYLKESVWVVFEQHMYDNAAGEMIDNWEIQFTREPDGGYSFIMGEPTPNYDGSQPADPGAGDEPEEEYYVPTYTWAEIQQMKAEKDKEIVDLELKVKVETVKYEKLQLEMTTGLITATVDGVVKTLIPEEEALLSGMPMCVVSGGGGYYIEGTLTELELESVKVGQSVTVMSYMSNYAEMQGTIIEISEYPNLNGYSWNNGNTNVSYYPFTVFIDDSASLMDGEYVTIQYSPASEDHGLYLENPFILKEGSKSYVFLEGEDGKLEKREVVTGKTLWSSYTQILSGLSLEDQIAFPYGKDVKEGAPVNRAPIDELYGVYY